MNGLSEALLGFLGGIAALVAKEAVSWYFSRLRLEEALKAEATGAILEVEPVIEQARATSEAASAISEKMKLGQRVTFKDIDKLYAGWVLSAPKVDLVAFAERFYGDSARNVTYYLASWAKLIECERRYAETFKNLVAVVSNAVEQGDADASKYQYGIEARELAELAGGRADTVVHNARQVVRHAAIWATGEPDAVTARGTA